MGGITANLGARMHVVSTCPLRVGSIVWRPRPSVWTLTVVCKATFLLAPAESRLADTQDEPAAHDRHLGGDAARSLHSSSDLAPFKPRADIVLVGSAFAAHRRPARSVVTRLQVGEVDKRVEVWCDRVFAHDGRLLEAQPFARMPLVYERAAGGAGTTNPVGVRFDAAPDAYGAVQIPNLQPTGLQIARRGDTFSPIGFGPIAPAWPERTDRLHRHAAGWSHQGWNARPLPSDIDPAYFNAAPADQQVESIRANERIHLENLHPEHPLLVTRLPGLRPRAHMMAGSSKQEEIALVADTLWIDADRGLATVVWRGRIALSHAAEEGRILVSMDAGEGTTASVAMPPDADEGGTQWIPSGEHTARFAGLNGAAPLPFKAASSAGVALGRMTLPLPSASPPEDTGTMFGVRVPAREALPFGSSGSAVESAENAEENSGTLRLTAAQAAAIFGAAALPFKAAPNVGAELAAKPTTSPLPSFSPPEDTGTLFGVQVPVRAAIPFAPDAPLAAAPPPQALFAPVLPGVSPLPPPPVEASPEGLPLARGAGFTADLLTLEAYAAIQAEVWVKRASLAAALAARGLEEEAYRLSVARLLRALDAEARDGNIDGMLRLSANLRDRIAALRADTTMDSR